MRPPSYYAARASPGPQSSGTERGSSSSKQWRTSIASPSSSSYVTRTHLPYVSQSMLVAHCIAGANSSCSSSRTARTYSGTSHTYSTSSASARSRSSIRYPSTAGASSSLSLASPGHLSSLRHQPAPSLSSSHLSNLYRPARLRDRPLLAQLSRHLPTAAASSLSSHASRRPTYRPPDTSSSWLSDVGRNISRNKYLIKFRELERPARTPAAPSGPTQWPQAPPATATGRSEGRTGKLEPQVHAEQAMPEAMGQPEGQQMAPSTKLAPAGTRTNPGQPRIRFRDYHLEDFNFLSVLGHGGWGFVILAELRDYDACFAVKCIKKLTIVEDDDLESIMIERKVLALGNLHPFICKLFCTFETEGYLFFAMEFCSGGDLMFHVQRDGKFTEPRCRFYAAEIICAIRFLHGRHIIYRDLKLDNILLDAAGHVRLVDFGMCQWRSYRDELLPSNFCGTPEYISPEIIKGVPYNHSVDWWSFGVLLYEMAVGKMPFRGGDENELLWNVCHEQIHYPMFLSKELSSLLQLLLEREPDRRMGMTSCKAGDIKDQPWFRGLDWRACEQLKLEPPFKPEVSSMRDVSNFDTDFTEARAELSPVDEASLNKINQQQFQQFPYTNPDLSFFDQQQQLLQ